MLYVGLFLCAISGYVMTDGGLSTEACIGIALGITGMAFLNTTSK